MASHDGRRLTSHVHVLATLVPDVRRAVCVMLVQRRRLCAQQDCDAGDHGERQRQGD